MIDSVDVTREMLWFGLACSLNGEAHRYEAARRVLVEGETYAAAGEVTGMTREAVRKNVDTAIGIMRESAALCGLDLDRVIERAAGDGAPPSGVDEEIQAQEWAFAAAQLIRSAHAKRWRRRCSVVAKKGLFRLINMLQAHLDLLGEDETGAALDAASGEASAICGGAPERRETRRRSHAGRVEGG